MNYNFSMHDTELFKKWLRHSITWNIVGIFGLVWDTQRRKEKKKEKKKREKGGKKREKKKVSSKLEGKTGKLKVVESEPGWSFTLEKGCTVATAVGHGGQGS